jgi:GNAT-family acetyltransferase (TIGR03103 family)
VTGEGEAPVDLEGYQELNPYTRIIVDKALARDIAVEIVDPALGELILSFGGRTITTLESLSELTSAVAFRRCDDKLYTRRVLEEAGLSVPRGRAASFDQADLEFLQECKELVVKPVRGEQGWGVTIGVTTAEELERACSRAREYWREVLLEERCLGQELRVVVIGEELVAAALRQPPEVEGTGDKTVAELIEETSRVRSEATDGAASIPLDDVTRKTVSDAGSDFDNVLTEGEKLSVRRTGNLHTGGTMHDVTDELHPGIVDVVLAATRAVGLPVAGVDLYIDSVDVPDAVIIEVNEQPGLAYHEPRPTADRFLDLLFPEARRAQS